MLLQLFKILQIVAYDGKANPRDHSLLGRGATEEIQCLFFWKTLKCLDTDWFYSLEPDSIVSFNFLNVSQVPQDKMNTHEAILYAAGR